MKQDILRRLPAVDTLLRTAVGAQWVTGHGHDAVAGAARRVIDGLRQKVSAGEALDEAAFSLETVLEAVGHILQAGEKPALRRVINATGIILHTGLGRACMPEVARAALAEAAGYCNLQQDLHTGQRDRREECLREVACRLTGAADVALVNNNAAATLLVLAALSRGREVIVSRGELIEIGGSFRLPDIMTESGAILREVGTTNKTHAKDYEKALGSQTGLLFKAHKSNYRIEGFTKDVPIADIAAIGRKHGVPVVDDLGCGALLGLEAFGLTHEPTVQESLAAGADIALFSTDKLIGGPQGGMIVGRADLIEKIRNHPLYRVFRVCKLTLAATEATLRLFASGRERLLREHPVYAMLARTPVELERQAYALKERLSVVKPAWTVSLIPETSFLGGGTVPEESLPTFAVRLQAPGLGADELALKLRVSAVPVFPRVKDGAVLLDMRTVSAQELDAVVNVVSAI